MNKEAVIFLEKAVAMDQMGLTSIKDVIILSRISAKPGCGVSTLALISNSSEKSAMGRCARIETLGFIRSMNERNESGMIRLNYYLTPKGQEVFRTLVNK